MKTNLTLSEQINYADAVLRILLPSTLANFHNQDQCKNQLMQPTRVTLLSTVPDHQS